MQYLETPAVITQTRVTPVFSFSELPAEIQESIIDARSNHPDYDWFSELLAEDIDLDVSQYWVPDHMLSQGITPRILKYRNSYPDYDINWSYDYRMSVWFLAEVDIETFILAHKLGRRFSLILSAARRGDIYSATVGQDTSRSYGHNPTDTVCTIDIDILPDETECEQRRLIAIETQCKALEEIIESEYERITGEMEKAFGNVYDYFGSTQYYRDQLSDDSTLYTIDGEEA